MNDVQGVLALIVTVSATEAAVLLETGRGRPARSTVIAYVAAVQAFTEAVIDVLDAATTS